MHVRGSRSITREVLEILAGGRTLEEQLEHTKREGIVFTAEVLRNSIIGGLEIWRKRRTAQNLIIFGCACYGTALPVKSYFQLLDRLGIEYTFLRKEYCCGAPFIAQAVLQGANRDQADQASRELLGMNIEQARGLGARRMFYLCSWCVYLAS